MWRTTKNPESETQAPASAPPVERGQRIATLPRGQDEELRISIDEYQGHTFVSVRAWARGEGGFWPTKRGVTIKVRELADVADALMQADRIINGGGPRMPG